MQENNRKITISLDCMGGDNGVVAVIGGTIKALQYYKGEVNFILCGNELRIKQELNKYKNSPFLNNLKIMHSDLFIGSNEKPSNALRQGKKSSMGISIENVKNGDADANISSGNTGALMALSKLILRALPGVDRPALIQLIPNKKGTATALLDMGANIECDSSNLYQFALMGSAFYTAVMKKQNPIIGILNVGSEDIKGNDAVKNSAIILKESCLKDNFYGFIEGNQLLEGTVDVITTDGFTGNVALKTLEGVVNFYSSSLKDIFTKNLFAKIGYLLIRKTFTAFKKIMSTKYYNGAMFIGLNGISVKSHGNATDETFFCAIQNTISLINGNINQNIVELIQSIDSFDSTLTEEEIENSNSI